MSRKRAGCERRHRIDRHLRRCQRTADAGRAA